MTWPKRAATWSAGIAVLLIAAFWRLGEQHWLTVHTGSSNVAGVTPNYNFYSGFGSIVLPWLGQVATIGALFWWHNQCAVDGCYWYAQRTTAAGERACWRHHPHPKRTAEDIHASHHAAVNAERGDSSGGT